MKSPEDTTTPDPVISPPHYNSGGIEALDAMVSAFGKEKVKHYCLANAFKYIWRCLHKNKEVEDIKKAIFYLRFAIGDDPRKDS
tara:strand:- start:99 stop:350 length:252 start_codon:yes stop_codon:yes gene_type:complete